MKGQLCKITVHKKCAVFFTALALIVVFTFRFIHFLNLEKILCFAIYPDILIIFGRTFKAYLVLLELESILTNFFLVEWTFFRFFAIKLGHLIDIALFSYVTK
jgi:hypothetical protein